MLKGESWKAQNAQKEKKKVQLSSEVSRLCYNAPVKFFGKQRFSRSSEIFSLERECIRQIGPFLYFINKPISVTQEVT